MKDCIRILLVTSDDEYRAWFDEPHIVNVLQRVSPGGQIEFHRVSDPSATVSRAPQVVLFHQPSSDESLAQCLVDVVGRWPDVPILGLFAAEYGRWPQLLNGVPAELHDFVLCPVDGDELVLRIGRVLAAGQRLKPHGIGRSRRVRIDSLVGESAIFQAQVDKIPLFADVDAPVLLQGETGTGKEVFARAVHYSSARKDHAFIPINCAALPDQLFENELFGHVKGAYTSAAGEQGGLVLEAEGGTLFLDEVDALNPYAQAKLLRFVQYREYRPLGCSRTKVANVRIIAASNHDLRQAVTDRQFREDLFHRLNVLSLVVPPLRERVEDIPLLANRFLQRFRRADGQGPRRLSEDAIQKLIAYAWPGNVRELESTLQRAVVMCGGETIHAQDIECAGETPKPLCLDGSLRAAKTSATMDVERAYLVRTLVTFRGNVTHAAKAAGKERRSFQRLLRKYGIDREAFQNDQTGPSHDCPPSFQTPFDGRA
ncbi:MAG: sigma-54-dependent Fis family transcriptional regulator [Nitrospira sp.]|nr:sigma-54-dependent Fis family transcriptional regulator [Nitrospira sp.]